MSGLFKSTIIKGNRLTDFAQTSATVGEVIPFGYGRFPVKGNIIWAPLPPKEHRQVKRQGKGGVKQESFTYTLSYCVAFCKGPIYGYWWIKRNGKVVYSQDPNAPVEDAAYAAKWLQKATLYYGTATQLPDSTIESYEGSGNVSAFRYIAHIVLEDDDTTDSGGAAPDFEAVVIASPPEVYLTSEPYPAFTSDASRVSIALREGELKQYLYHAMYSDESSVGGSLVSGSLVTPLAAPGYRELTTVGVSLGDSALWSPILIGEPKPNETAVGSNLQEGELWSPIIPGEPESNETSIDTALIEGELGP